MVSKIYVTNLQLKKEKIYLSLKSDSANAPEKIILFYPNITANKELPFDCTFSRQSGNTIIHAVLDTKGIVFQEGEWHLQAVFIENGQPESVPVILGSKTRIKLILGNYQIKMGAQHLFFPIIGIGRQLVFRYRTRTRYDGNFTRIKEYLAFIIYKIFRPIRKKKSIWIVYEKYSHNAQDNGYYFFKYCMENLSENKKKNIFFILDKDSNDWKKMQIWHKNILPFMSFRHIFYTLSAKIFIAPEARAHAYIWKPKPNLISREINKKNIFFLQHGVLALKRVEDLFGKSNGHPMTYFTTSSQAEQKIVTENFGYAKEESPILGLTRWDVLEDQSAAESTKSILIMPTWRSWLEDQSDEVFCSSDYYKKYTHLLQNKELLLYLKEHQVKLVFHIHPKLHEFMKTFHVSEQNVELITYGKTPLNELLMKCSMLITDYSSVCWDVFYQKKPILFYQFDLDLYNQSNGSYINMEKELFGDRFLSEDALILGIKEYIQKDFQEKKLYAKMRPNLLEYCDHNNCKRTYDFIKNEGY